MPAADVVPELCEEYGLYDDDPPLLQPMPATSGSCPFCGLGLCGHDQGGPA